MENETYVIRNKVIHYRPKLSISVSLIEEEKINYETMKKEKMWIFSASATTRFYAGQCLDRIDKKFFDNNTTNFNRNLNLLIKMWEKYHLNDLEAGTKKQVEFLEKTGFDTSANNYTDVCKLLEENNLLYDMEYKYGSKWLCREIPEKDVEQIKNMILYFKNL